MTRDEAVTILDQWTVQPMVRKLMPLIVTAIRVVIGKPAITVGDSKVKLKAWREAD